MALGEQSGIEPADAPVVCCCAGAFRSNMAFTEWHLQGFIRLHTLQRTR
jgi:hypothetical protein